MPANVDNGVYLVLALLPDLDQGDRLQEQHYGAASDFATVSVCFLLGYQLRYRGRPEAKQIRQRWCLSNCGDGGIHPHDHSTSQSLGTLWLHIPRMCRYLWHL